MTSSKVWTNEKLDSFLRGMIFRIHDIVDYKTTAQSGVPDSDFIDSLNEELVGSKCVLEFVVLTLSVGVHYEHSWSRPCSRP